MEAETLLKKLNDLKQIKPDEAWKGRYREILRSQISAGENYNEAKSNLGIIWHSVQPRQLFISLTKPVWLTSLASFLLMAIVLGGVYASQNTKPGDSLYIAKIISERAQLAMTFDEKDKTKLSLEFAANRAKEITQVLKDAGQNDQANQEKLDKLSQDFKKEIGQAKNRLTTLRRSGAGEESEVFGANLGKNDERLEISVPEVKSSPAAVMTVTSTPATTNLATSSPVVSGRAGEILEEAEKLFDEKNYDGTINKIEEVKQLMDKSDDGQVKGASETATTTNNN